MVKYQKYAEYKDSGVEWFSNLPIAWRVGKLKQIVDQNRQITYGIVQAGPNIENGVPYIRPADMSDEKGIKNFDELLRTSESIASSYDRSKIKSGDIICSIGPSFGKVMITPAVLDGANLTQGTARIAISSENNPRYFFWSLRSTISFSQWESVVGGATFRALNLGPLADTYIALPSFDEQEKIANFLDHETTKIDTLIAKQEKLIELLKEKRQAVISHAVTKGINPNVPMKNSGVEWLGEVPEHWGVSLIKYQCREITDGAHISPELENGEYLFVSIRDIKEGVINFDDALLTSEKSYQYLVHTGCMPFEGDILFSKDGTIGQTAITPPNVDFVVASSLIIIRPQFYKVIPEFLDLLLRSDVVQEQVESFVKGAALRRLSIQNLLKIWGVFPPLTEQKELVGFVQLQLEKYKVLEVQAERQVELLRERRTALISAAVTGKIDVRNWQNPVKNNNQDNMELSA